MAKDILGNTLKVGDTIIFNNMQCKISEINENRILGGKFLAQNKGMTMKIPDVMTLEIDIQYDSDKPVNGFAVKLPPETQEGQA